ncbi:MAG: hypothetical protein JO048_10990 [Methylobacteriaceae bacterium]|nr:hypothetical protein [Methylobacteriaceae bacterium]
MRQQSAAAATNVVRFPGPRAARQDGRDQKSLLDTVYTNGAFVVAADDRETKAIAARLQVFGFLNIGEISMDGSVRPLKASETSATSTARPWRLSRPSFDELPPLAG